MQYFTVPIYDDGDDGNMENEKRKKIILFKKKI